MGPLCPRRSCFPYVALRPQTKKAAQFFNTFLVKKLPLVEGIVLIVHIFGFFGVIITLWVLGPRGNAHDVFTTFNNYGGWSSDGLSAVVGILAVMIPLLGADGAVHMSEELRDASKVSEFSYGA